MDKATYEITKQALIDVPVVAETRTYKPVSHEQLMDLTLNAISNSGFKVETERYTAARDGQVANGRYTISNVKDNEMCLQVGWQNSYNRQISLKWALGGFIFICSNGTVHGEMGNFKKKHQGNIQEFAPTAITEYIKRAGDIFTQMQKDREAMKQIEISDRVKAELIGRMFIEEDILASTQLNTIARNLKSPEFDYKCPNSMWELYSFVTQSMRDLHPTLWIENHIKAHNFFTKESGIIVPKAEIVVPTPGSHPQGDLFSNEAQERFNDVLLNINE